MMEVRYVTAADNFLDMSDIYEKSWKFAYRGTIPDSYLDSIPKDRWVNSIASRHSLVMSENDQIIGTASFGKSRWAQYGDYGEIFSIYLLPQYMGKGYGQYLLNTCVKELQKSGFHKIMLWVLEENQRARKFYEKNGFLCADIFLNDTIGGKNLREVMYVLTDSGFEN